MTVDSISPVSWGLDAFLTLLLLAALAVGWRLNGKLKSLKESQAGFVKAVAELDLAAGRAEAGLEALRAATQEAHDTLLDRIDSARTIQARLDRACEDAVAAALRAEAAAARRPAPLPERAPERASASLRPVDAAPAAEPDRAAVLRLIETAREEAGAPPLTLVPAAAARPAAVAPTPEPVDRLAAFVARRREARAG